MPDARRALRLLERIARSGDLRAFSREARRLPGREHVYMTHEEDCGPQAPCRTTLRDCPWDDSGLASCRACGLAEGALTIHCLGEGAWYRADDVYARRVDFVAGEWIRIGARGGCPA